MEKLFQNPHENGLTARQSDVSCGTVTVVDPDPPDNGDDDPPDNGDNGDDDPPDNGDDPDPPGDGVLDRVPGGALGAVVGLGGLGIALSRRDDE